MESIRRINYGIYYYFQPNTDQGELRYNGKTKEEQPAEDGI
jgi:hypothetical protein